MSPKIQKAKAAEELASGLLSLAPEEYGVLLDSVPVLIAFVDAQERLTYVNRSYEVWFGRSRQDLAGAHLREVLGETGYAFVQTHARAALAGTPTSYERLVQHRDGSARWVRISVVPSRRGGVVNGFFAVGTDVTDLIQAQDELRGSERKFRAIFQEALNGILLISKAGVIIDANTAFCRLLGRKRDEIVGQSTDAFVSPDAAPDLDAIRDHLRAKRSWRGEFPLRRLDGSLVHLQWNLSSDALEDADLAVVTDISERERAAEALRAAVEEKDALLRELQHRVKNNLQFILSLLALRGGQFGDAAIRLEFEQTSNRVRAIAYAQDQLYRSGDVSQIDLAEYLHTICSVLLGPHADRLTLRFEAEPVVLHIAKAIPIGLVVNEIVMNSIAHAFPGERSGTVSVGLRTTPEGWAELGVEDDGVGTATGQAPQAGRTSGLALVGLLAGQAGAEVEQNWSGGARFRIKFRAS